MKREEQKNLSFPSISSYPPLEYNPPASSGNPSTTFMDQGILPH
jgi:hypothetical protein